MPASHTHEQGLHDATARTCCAGPGSTVKVVDRHGRTTVYELLAREPDPTSRRVTVESPEGLALLGARSGDALTVRTPNGRRRRVQVLDVSAAPSTSHADPGPDAT